MTSFYNTVLHGAKVLLLLAMGFLSVANNQASYSEANDYPPIEIDVKAGDAMTTDGQNQACETCPPSC